MTVRADALTRAEEILASLGVSAVDVQIAIDRAGEFVAISRAERTRRLAIDEAVMNLLLSRGATWDS
ncbi:MAG TPA: hypothetical protein VGG28_06810 [Kofleriaceae bacterium]